MGAGLMMPLLGIAIGTGAGKAGLEGCRRSVVQECRLIGIELLVAVVGAHRIVICVGIVLKRRIADAEPSANHCLIGGAVGKADARSEVGVPGLQTEIGRIRSQAGNDQGVRGRIVIGKASGIFGSGRRIELPAKSEVCSQLRRDLPFVSGEGEEPPGAKGGEVGIDIAA